MFSVVLYFCVRNLGEIINMNISAVSYAMSAPKKVAFGNQQSYTPAGFSSPVTPEQLKDGLLKDIKQVVKPEQGKTQLTPEQQQIIDIVGKHVTALHNSGKLQNAYASGAIDFLYGGLNHEAGQKYFLQNYKNWNLEGVN